MGIVKPKLGSSGLVASADATSGTTVLMTLDPVSYTHLDVYKRQFLKMVN